MPTAACSPDLSLLPVRVVRHGLRVGIKWSKFANKKLFVNRHHKYSLAWDSLPVTAYILHIHILMCSVLTKTTTTKLGTVVELGKGPVAAGKHPVRLHTHLWLFSGFGCVEGEEICNCCLSGGARSKSGVGDVTESRRLAVFG